MYDFSTHLTAVADRLTDAFPAVATVAEYPRVRQKITTPAILIEVADATPADDAGTGQLCLTARFEARVVLGQAPAAAGDNPGLRSLELAAAVAHEIFSASRFGQEAGPSRNVRIEPDRFRPELAGYAVWLIEWSHEIRLGASVWDGVGTTPTDIYLGLSPEIGLGHEGDYLVIAESDEEASS